MIEPIDNLAQVLADALDDRYADADPEDLDAALDDVLDSMSDGEAFNFTNALRQIEAAAGRALADPTVGRVVGTALPLGASALGTVIGGPAGTAVGGQLGRLVAQRLAPTIPGQPLQPLQPGQPGQPGQPRQPGQEPTQAGVAGGSSAAMRAFILANQDDTLRALLSLAMGAHGKKDVNGVPVASILNMAKSVFEEAAADADELMYLDGGYDGEAEEFAGIYGDGEGLYQSLMDVDGYELVDAEDWR